MDSLTSSGYEMTVWVIASVLLIVAIASGVHLSRRKRAG